MKEPSSKINKQLQGQTRIDDLREKKRALIIGFYESGRDKPKCAEHLLELESLCDTYGLEVIIKEPCFLKKIDVATYIGKGKVVEIFEKAQNKYNTTY